MGGCVLHMARRRREKNPTLPASSPPQKNKKSRVGQLLGEWGRLLGQWEILMAFLRPVPAWEKGAAKHENLHFPSSSLLHQFRCVPLSPPLTAAIARRLRRPLCAMHITSVWRAQWCRGGGERDKGFATKLAPGCERGEGGTFWRAKNESRVERR